MLSESGFLRIIYTVELYGESEDSDYIVHHQIFHLFTNFILVNRGKSILFNIYGSRIGYDNFVQLHRYGLMTRPVNETNHYTY